ncbi:MurR/RpiR family transcriptional regulator [Parenemella sanctibonifatiensis]|uniref:MurR/RpiR family transcriptional regulator n=1 Tax=Parenemella sanctibonifatiensis TaxID=2016505 RepID=UPI001E3DC6C0|nr:MurR/RpiR family transcriptional regulator [Parenemella sanctibonifatiensis]
MTDVVSALREVRGSLHPAMVRIADVILDDPERAVGLSIADLATAAGTSQATVVRLARQVGFSGYRDFRFALRGDLEFARGRRVLFAGEDTDIGADLSPTDNLAETVRKVALADTQAVADTAARIDLGVLARVVDAVAQARQIVTFGVGASAFAAMDLQQKLARIGRAATSYVDAHQGLPAVALLGNEDVAIGISDSGRTIDVVDALTIAGDRGATTVAITNASRSALAEAADHTLLTAAQESTFRSGATASRIAQLSLVDIVFVGVAQRHYDSARESLSLTRRAVQDRRI